ncbi:SRPBCC family protein [Mycolicibacterium sp.]|uniref:SRPBCC family protein n=1 Tax=Mycolicibacterium sp. TaxID=2320850 RepID=UPI001A269C6F|nr:SRPBCC family protein [Mycolicibacterium sp.]MBJ7336764.1 SRPBCC family protein [Mycolicibacterium sp.]
MASPLSGSVSTSIAASPERVWALISGQNSATGPMASRWREGPSRALVGRHFHRNVQHDGACPIYWSHLTIRASEPGSVFAFTVDLPWRPAATWRYDLRPSRVGTEVTESYELADTWYYHFYASFARRWRTRHHRKAGTERLDRIKRAAEAK